MYATAMPPDGGMHTLVCEGVSWSEGPDRRRRIRYISAAGPESAAKALRRALSTESGEVLVGGVVRVRGRQRLRIALRKVADETWHLVGLAEDSFTGDAAAGDVDEALLWALKKKTGVPLLPEWAGEIRKALEAKRLVQPWNAAGDTPKGLDILLGDDPRGALLPVVQELIGKGAVFIPKGMSAPDRDVTDINTIDAYMRNFGGTLGKKTAGVARHIPGTARDPGLPRRLFPAQADAAEAVAKTWADGERHVWLVGEQGVGKTTIALAAAHLHLGGRPGRILVHCPGHLTGKWEREAKAVLPEVTIHHVRDWRDAMAATAELLRRPLTTEVWIMARDSGKLGWNWKAAHRTDRDGRLLCPSCGKPLVRVFKDKKTPPEPWPPESMRHRGETNRCCPSCKSPLWQADPAGPRRVAPTRLWSKRLRTGAFDVVIGDEIHEEKGDSAQGQSLGRLLRLGRKSLLLTGTLLGGKASDMHYHLARTQPERMREYGYGYRSPSAFVAAYGVTERKIRDGKTVQTLERAGIHPALFGDWLMGRSVFLELEDLEADLPPYEEEVRLVTMSPEQKALVEEVTARLRGAAAASLRAGHKGALGTYIQAALAYPDRVFTDRPILYAGKPLVTPPGHTDPGKILPKEAAIAATVLKEAAQGRRSAVFAEFTGVYDVTRRLKETLEDQGLSVALLTADVKPEEREAWIRSHKEDVLLCHPRLVATGLDLLEFPTIIWAQTGWSLFTVRQASRRSWRIGQTEPVKVLFFAYEDTLQATALQVLAEKMLAAQAVEGRFSPEGLQALAEGSNTTLRLAEALAYGLAELPDIREAWRTRTEAETVLKAEHVAEAEPAMVVVLPTPITRPVRRGRRWIDPNQVTMLDLLLSG
jgi:superfamily II DNA or RNA helicase